MIFLLKTSALALMAPKCREENPFVSAAADTKDWKEQQEIAPKKTIKN